MSKINKENIHTFQNSYIQKRVE